MTEEEIDAARTPAGGWTRATLAKWGVPWPPPRGWRKRLLASDLTAKPIQTRGANSRLIASAPALYAALDQLLDDMGDDGLSVCQAAKDQAIAALAKARGET